MSEVVHQTCFLYVVRHITIYLCVAGVAHAAVAHAAAPTAVAAPAPLQGAAGAAASASSAAVAAPAPLQGVAGAAASAGSSSSSEAQLAAPAPPPPPVALDGGHDRSRRLGGDWERVDVPGGYLLWSRRLHQLDAHCATHPNCKMDRTLNAPRFSGSFSGQGRPVGLHMAWLAAGPTTADKYEHLELKKSLGRIGSHAARVRGREVFMGMAQANLVARAILEDERPRHEGESAEPASVP